MSRSRAKRRDAPLALSAAPGPARDPRTTAFLVSVGDALAEAQGWGATLDQITRLAVPRIADWCAIDAIGDDGGLEHAALRHADATLLARARSLLDGAPSRTRLGVPLDEARSPLLVTDIAAPTAASRVDARLASLGVRSIVSVPLEARGRLLGVLGLARSAPHPLGDEELTLARELAQRAALSLENANLRRRLEEAVRLRDEFLLAAAHDLRTPVGVLLMHVRHLSLLAGRDGGTGGRMQQRLGAMDRQLFQMTQLLDKLLDVTRVSSEELVLEREELDLARLARDVCERLRDQIAWARCELTVEANQPVVGRWDATRLDQVLSNLLTNAMKYGYGTPITVGVERDGERARLVVRDRGIGIAPEDQARVFHKFVRTDEARRASGMGLGLWIVRRIAQAHGGTVAVTSAPGEGATFTVELPIVFPPAAGAR